MIGRAELEAAYAASENDEPRELFEAAGIDFAAFEYAAGEVARGALNAWLDSGRGDDLEWLGQLIANVFVDGGELVLRVRPPA